MRGIFGNTFDLDGDGRLNLAELAADYMAFENLMAEGKDEDDIDAELDGDLDDFDDLDD